MLVAPGTGHEAEALPGQAEPLALLDDQEAVGEVDQPVGAELGGDRGGQGVVEVATSITNCSQKARQARSRAPKRSDVGHLDSSAIVASSRPAADAAGVRFWSSASQPRSMATRRRHSSSRTGSTAFQAATSAAASCRATSGVPASTVSIRAEVVSGAVTKGAA